MAVRSVTQTVLVERTHHAAEITSRVKHYYHIMISCTRKVKGEIVHHVGDYNQQGHHPHTCCMRGAECMMAESDGKAGSQAVSVDMDAMIDEILARKGPQKYRDGLSEDNWEQVGSSPPPPPPPPQ